MTRSIEDLPIRPLTKRLVNNLIFDKPVGLPEILDFGIDSADHYRALKTIVLYGDEQEDERLSQLAEDDDLPVSLALEGVYQRIIELDQALGNGPALNALVRKYAPEYAKVVHFHTSWDEIFGRRDESAEEA